MVTRSNANVKSASGTLAVKQPFSGRDLIVEKVPPKPQDSQKNAERNPWIKGNTVLKRKNLAKVVVAEKALEEELSVEDEEWVEVKSRRRVNRNGVVSPKPAQSEVVEKGGNTPSMVMMDHELEWLVLMKVGTPVKFRGLNKRGNLNGTAGVIVSVVETNKRFVASTTEGRKVSVAQDKLQVVEDDDILLVEDEPMVNSSKEVSVLVRWTSRRGISRCL